MSHPYAPHITLAQHPSVRVRSSTRCVFVCVCSQARLQRQRWQRQNAIGKWLVVLVLSCTTLQLAGVHFTWNVNARSVAFNAIRDGIAFCAHECFRFNYFEWISQMPWVCVSVSVPSFGRTTVLTFFTLQFSVSQSCVPHPRQKSFRWTISLSFKED